GSPQDRSGVRVATADLGGDRQADPVTGSGSDGVATAYSAATLTTAGAPDPLASFDPFPGFTGGVFVG
ncbi:MAG TPA: hypothetical protein VKE74_22205, partial [Gemmataceae bacterium]|nr:hypothetical protein [Gemmataceae bacterium]